LVLDVFKVLLDVGGPFDVCKDLLASVPKLVCDVVLFEILVGIGHLVKGEDKLVVVSATELLVEIECLYVFFNGLFVFAEVIERAAEIVVGQRLILVIRAKESQADSSKSGEVGHGILFLWGL
jgi:hypothetical protein